MNICFFTENYYKGGLDTFVLNLVNAWPDTKDKLTLVCNSSHPGLETIREKAVRPLKINEYSRAFTSRIVQGLSSSRHIRSFPARAFFELIYRALQYPVLFPWYVISLAVFFRRSNFDRLMVINGGYPASLLCRCAAIAWRLAGKHPLATFNFHNSATRPPWYFALPEYLIDRAVIRSVEQIVSVSENCLGTLNQRNAFRGCAKLSCIFNGIEDPKRLLKDAQEELPEQDTSDPYCLMLATYEPRKGHGYLLQAFKMVVKNFPDVRLKVFGYGKQHEKERVAKEVGRQGLNGNVLLDGFAPDTASLIAGARVLVVPSQAYESFGLTIIEAMALGVPVVATDVGGIPEVLADSHAGYVCSRTDPASFAKAIIDILGNPALATELGRNGRHTYEQRYSALTMSLQYESLIKGKGLQANV